MPDPQQLDYAALAAKARQGPAAVDYEALASQARTAPVGSKPAAAPTAGSTIGDLTDSFMRFGHALIIEPLQGILEMAKTVAADVARTGSPDTAIGNAVVSTVVKGIGASHQHEYDAYLKAATEGRTADAVGHAFAYAVPILGPQIGHAIEEGIKTRDWATATGRLTAATAPVLAGAVAGDLSIPALIKNPNQAEAMATEFGLTRGLPVDVGTATGNVAAKGAQYLADRSIGGSLGGAAARQASAEAFTRVGGELAAEASPAGATTPELAGQGIISALTKKVADLHQAANTAYSRLRAIESDPKYSQTVTTGTRIEDTGLVDANGAPITRTVPVTESIALPVDLRAAKAALKPLYERIVRQSTLVQQSASKGLVGLRNIVEGPDMAPASQVDMDLGLLKQVSREADSPALRDVSQGLAAKAVKTLAGDVQTAIGKAGPDALTALEEGRAATKAKYAVADVIDDVGASGEPVGAFRKAIAPKDAGIETLRSIADHAPQTLPVVGRAYLEDLLQTATAGGAFDRAQGLWAKWQTLGPQTKALLFKDQPGLVMDLDHFFLLAKKVAESPNSSNSAGVASLGVQTGALGAGAIHAITTGELAPVLTVAGVEFTAAMASKLLRSQTFVKLLTRGVIIQKGSFQAQAVGSQLLQTAQAVLAAPDNLSPVLAGSTPTTPSGPKGKGR